ncbi:hypothetical protein P43SY_010220 [Pythium insidiosum]|uniref:Uncharacterized protein n=1 Tax=Pythium insidiosum TaxID=114742 RepID=A0AAD5L8D7_PYTIN|nr:hypothetical protein P43SY_010220 [Pythium insidiosum]
MSPNATTTVIRAHHCDVPARAPANAHTSTSTSTNPITNTLTYTAAVCLVETAQEERVAAIADFRRSTPSLLEIEQEAIKLGARIECIIQRLGDALVSVVAAKALLDERDVERRCSRNEVSELHSDVNTNVNADVNTNVNADADADADADSADTSAHPVDAVSPTNGIVQADAQAQCRRYR